MASTTSAPLNAEPARPADREASHLPPKSYKQAVEQEPPSGTNYNANGIDEQNHTSVSQNGDRHIGVLRITNTHGEKDSPEDEEKNADAEKDSGRPGFNRQESKHEYTAEVSSHWLIVTTFSFDIST